MSWTQQDLWWSRSIVNGGCLAAPRASSSLQTGLRSFTWSPVSCASVRECVATKGHWSENQKSKMEWARTDLVNSLGLTFLVLERCLRSALRRIELPLLLPIDDRPSAAREIFCKSKSDLVTSYILNPSKAFSTHSEFLKNTKKRN